MNSNGIEYVKAGSSAVAIVTALLGGISWVNQTYVNYLQTTLATKTELRALESKLDWLIEREIEHGKSQNELGPQRPQALPKSP